MNFLKGNSDDLWTWNDINLFHANSQNDMKKLVVGHILQNLDMEVNDNAVNKALGNLSDFEQYIDK